ncbi:hypothetical protein [Mucilaginibacter sp. SJ]|uniref:hypothetical protein n=1 Tax=Mucilaginibacter sp. SJ TaxID=3029053 RepID=UPI0023A93FDB|nr:hypothetical protein [Mucilaginibacter sp. SJ]WEA02300.1 hypothetical protein MusilaSJ_05085 [Mucilaginibacter sp. SJ]
MVALFCQWVLARRSAGSKKLKKTSKKAENKSKSLSDEFILLKVLVIDNQIFIDVSGEMLKI